MTRTLSVILSASALLASFAACSEPGDTASAGVASLDSGFDRGILMIESDDGVHHEFDIYLAVDVDQQRRGLMFVRKMPENMGMLFVYSNNVLH